MGDHIASHTLQPTRSALLAVLNLAVFAGLCLSAAAQSGKVPAWQTAAGSKMSFDVASVRLDRSDTPGTANVDLLASDTFSPTGGLYIARNVGLPEYISFAYKLPMDQFITLVEQVSWLAGPRFDIEARASGNPTKDQYRLMMQSLLAERFKIAVHSETHQGPVLEVRLIHPGQLGPKLRQHAADDPVCLNALPPPPSAPDVDSAGYPLFCGRPSRITPSTPGGLRFGGRDVTMAQFAASPMRVMAGVDRPLVDKTGIRGKVDFTLQWALAAENVVHSPGFHKDESLPEFGEALSHQLGLKLVSGRGPIEAFIIDRVERPSEN